jgi:zinc protease
MVGEVKLQERLVIPSIDTRLLPGPADIQTSQLDNGITILVRHNPHSPAVVTRGYLTCGSLGETRNTAGLATLTAAGLKLGTKGYSRDELYERIEAIGGQLSIGSGKSRTQFFTKSLAEDLGSILKLLAETIQRPTFPEEKYAALKARHLTGLKLRSQDTFSAALIAFYELLYGDHPFAFNLDGYPESIEHITADDCRLFHGQHFHPQGMVIAVVGGIEPSEAVQRVADEFAGWQPDFSPSELALPDWQAPKKPGRRHISLDDRSQCDIIMGVAGPGQNDEDYLPAYVGNYILGQYGLSGRLGQSLREEAGLAYAAQSTLVSSRNSPPWVVYCGVAPENVDRALDLIDRELQRFTTERVSEEELLECQAFLIGSLPLTVESNEAVAEALLDMVYYDRGLDYYQRIPDLIAGIDRQQILEAAQRYIKLESIATAVAGPIPAWEA